MAGKIVFVHGWGFDASFWDGVRGLLPEYDTSAVDLGFFGVESIVKGDIYITHSMGLAWTLQNAQPKALMSINGFTRFCATEDWPQGVAPRLLSRMIRQFDKKPETVWSDFMKNSGMRSPHYPSNAKSNHLRDGLERLQNWDVRQQYAAFEGPKTNLAGCADKIVPENLTTASFGKDVIWYIEGNHLLPLSAPEWTSTQIRLFLDSL